MTSTTSALTDAYLDTSFVIAATISGTHHASAAREFQMHLANWNTRNYFSGILRIEVSQALLRIGSNPARLASAVRSRFILGRWDQDILTRHRWMAHGVNEFESMLLRLYQVYELPISLDIWQRSVSIMAHYRLHSIDAIHVATAQTIGVRNFVTCDADFRRVDGLNVILVRDQT